MLSTCYLALCQKFQQHLEDKTQHTFSLDPKENPQVLVRSFFDLVLMTVLRSYRYYARFYAQGAYETPHLNSLLWSVIKHDHREDEKKDMIRALISLFETPQLWLSFLTDYDEKYLGYSHFKKSTEHLDFIANNLNLNCCDHLLELGTSTGTGQLYLAQQAACHLTSITLSSRHEQKLNNIYAQQDYPLHLIAYEKLNDLQSFENRPLKPNKILIQSFFEPLDLSVIEKCFDAVQQEGVEITFYFQGLVSPGFEKALKKKFQSLRCEETYHFQKEALNCLENKHQQLFEHRVQLEEPLYRVWRLYFIKRLLELKRQYYQMIALKGSIEF